MVESLGVCLQALRRHNFRLLLTLVFKQELIEVNVRRSARWVIKGAQEGVRGSFGIQAGRFREWRSLVGTPEALLELDLALTFLHR